MGTRTEPTTKPCTVCGCRLRLITRLIDRDGAWVCKNKIGCRRRVRYAARLSDGPEPYDVDIEQESA